MSVMSVMLPGTCRVLKNNMNKLLKTDIEGVPKIVQHISINSDNESVNFTLFTGKIWCMDCYYILDIFNCPPEFWCMNSPQRLKEDLYAKAEIYFQQNWVKLGFASL